jgi:two-component system response regulator YesN
MVVDDEEMERNLIKVCINWNELKMKIVASISNAREALDSIDELKPDIIITDIRMPFMDGLEFSKIVSDTYPYIKVIILTAHEEFEYAKVGIKVGISDFLLKPIKRSELKETLLNVSKKIYKEREYNNKQEELKKQLEENFPILKDKFLNELLVRTIYETEFVSKLNYYSINLKPEYTQVALLETEYADNHNNIIEYDNNYILGFKCLNLVKKYFRDDINIEIFTDNSHRIVILNSNNKINLEECSEQIKTMIINTLKCFVTIGIGNRYKKYGYIKKSYMEAVESLNYKIVSGKNSIVSFSEININNDELSLKIDKISEIGFNLKIGAIDKIFKLIDEIFEEYYSTNASVIDYIKISGVNIITVILNSASEIGINFLELSNDKNTPYDKIMKYNTIPEVKTYIKDFAQNVIRIIKDIRKSKTNKVVSEIIEYLSNNLSNYKLSLTYVAKLFYLNVSYLSRIFKNETGHTFIEYLTRERIEKSIRLFQDTDLMVYEVAEKVGIPDPNYFGKCFKKQTGMSVNDFKKNL